MFANNTGEAAEYCLVYDAFQKWVFHAEVCLLAIMYWGNVQNGRSAAPLCTPYPPNCLRWALEPCNCLVFCLADTHTAVRGFRLVILLSSMA